MTTINLLPWRDQLRKTQKNKFILIIGLTIAAMLLINAISFVHFKSENTYQLARVNLLQNELTLANKLLDEKKPLAEQQADLSSQMQTLVQIHNQRLLVAELLNTLPSLLPEGVYLQAINVVNNVITLQGYAPTSTQISLLVKHLNLQNGWQNIQLQQIVSDDKMAGKSQFIVTFTME